MVSGCSSLGFDMGKTRFIQSLVVVVAALAAGVLLAPVGSATQQGGAAGAQGNRGDVWVDNPGHLGDPGHENDPHICGLIDIYGNGLADAAGSFQVVAWPPTGDGSTVVASGSWSYDQTLGGNQVIAGPLSLAEGHYKLMVSQDPRKAKVFWSTCPVLPTPTPTGGAWPFPTP
jgi:hypothetical protein